MLQQIHCDQLINTLFPFAQHMLASHGEFFPFGAFVNGSGTVEEFAGHTGDEQPKPQEVIQLLSTAARTMIAEGRCRAVGICVNVCTVLPGSAEKTDAALASLEDANGALNVYLPYRQRSDGKIEYGAPVAEQATPTLFPNSPQ